jgi:hypothetical protein
MEFISYRKWINNASSIAPIPASNFSCDNYLGYIFGSLFNSFGAQFLPSWSEDDSFCLIGVIVMIK